MGLPLEPNMGCMFVFVCLILLVIENISYMFHMVLYLFAIYMLDILKEMHIIAVYPVVRIQSPDVWTKSRNKLD